jgi:hypothetical protein
MRNLGSTLDARAYALLAQRHRPDDQSGLTAAARDLSKRGLAEHDISVALGIGVDAVRSLLSAPASASGAAIDSIGTQENDDGDINGTQI